MSRFKIIDLASRVIPTTFFLLVLQPSLRELYEHLIAANPLWAGKTTFLPFFAEAISRAASVAFLALITVLFLIRLEPLEKAPGILPRLQAIAGSFLMVVVTFFPRIELSAAQAAACGLISLSGTALSVFALVHLGRSFSLMAEARRLVTTGPYRYIRHPLYLFEGTATVGVLLRHLSVATLLIFVVHIFIQICRIRNEEAVLAKAFPEYATYKNKTACLMPGVY